VRRLRTESSEQDARHEQAHDHVSAHHRHIQPVLICDWSPHMDGIAATMWASQATGHELDASTALTDRPIVCGNTQQTEALMGNTKPAIGERRW
jgi:hypothetical protein